MQLIKKTDRFPNFIIVLSLLIAFASCGQNLTRDNLTDPKPTTPQARKLVDSTCHFISKEQIAEFVNRYQKLKTSSDTSVAGGKLKFTLTDSCSFNNIVIRAILADKRCIGLRVVYGVGRDNKLHAIIVGIAPDYSTFYIKRPKEPCDPKAFRMLKRTDSSAVSAQDENQTLDDEEGAAEMGQLP